MRIALALGIAVMLVACGGNVVVDMKTIGTGGAGAGGSATGTTGTTVTMTDCSTGACSLGTDGSCTCNALCGEQKLVTVCVGVSCTCFENDIKIANCAGMGSNACDIQTGCCAAAYFGQGQ